MIFSRVTDKFCSIFEIFPLIGQFYPATEWRILRFFTMIDKFCNFFLATNQQISQFPPLFNWWISWILLLPNQLMNFIFFSRAELANLGIFLRFFSWLVNFKIFTLRLIEGFHDFFYYDWLMNFVIFFFYWLANFAAFFATDQQILQFFFSEWMKNFEIFSCNWLSNFALFHF